MSTLQKTLRYAGDVRKAPFADVELRFQIPAFRYLREGTQQVKKDADTSTPRVVRRPIATRALSVATILEAPSYRIEFPDALLAGQDKSLFTFYLQGVLSSGSVDDLFVTIEVDFVTPGLSTIGRQSLELIYYTKMLRGPLQLNAQAPDVPQAVLLIHRAAFFKLHHKLSAMASTFNPILLLEIVSALADVTRDHPILNTQRADSTRQDILAILTGAHIENAPGALEVIERGFESLFDTPLTIPEVKTVTIAGTFTVQTSDQSAILPQDLLLYDLQAEYSVRYTGEHRILNHSFRDVTTLENNATSFVFSAEDPLFREVISGSILIKVRGFDGSVVWSREFKPNDSHLDHLDIRVPLLRPNRPDTIDDSKIQDINKKLRGQVLNLGRPCPLKDLTVVVQARNMAGQPWRTVGATTTDSSGHFSMPYPYGIYTAAQAFVSLQPDDPTDIPITEAQHGATISDDFIYLFVREADCPSSDQNKPCDCHPGKSSSRLPDFADLIGSGEYSQDIGSGCVNLSTPNRTLSEFNYQAIVRISDPDVASYSLHKVEPPMEDVSSILNRLRASNAHTNQVIGVLFGLNTELNAALGPVNGASNAASSALLAALNAVVSPLNAALSPLHTSPVAALSVALESLNSAATSCDAFNARLNAAVQPMKKAIVDAVYAANAALEAALAAAKPPQDLLGMLSGPQSDFLNLLFNPLNVAVSASVDPAQAAAAREARERMYNSLAMANAVLNDALNVSQITLSTAMNAASAVSNADASTRYELVGGSQKISRRTVDLDNPIAWQDASEVPSSAVTLLQQDKFTATAKSLENFLGGGMATSNQKNLNFYQAVTVATGHILHYKVLFKADGYSLGDLLYSLPLAPGQKKQIVVLDASHTLQGAESQLLAQGERLAAGITDERQLLTELSGTLNESLRGSSSASTSGISAGFGTGGQGYGSSGAYGGSGSAVIGVAGGTASGNSNAAQDSSRMVSEFFAEKLRQSIMQNAESYRQLNASVVTTVQEGQRYGVTSEVVANHNHCHALTMMYFEVLRHYAVYQQLSSVEECVFVPLLMTHFTTQNIFKWRDVLARFLLPTPSDTYLQSTAYGVTGNQHPLIRAFDANERIRSRYANVDFPEGAYDDEPIQLIRGELRLRVRLPRPRTRFDRILSFPLTKQLDTKAVAGDSIKYSQDMAAYSVKVAATGGLLSLFEGPPNPPNPTQYEVIAREAIFDVFMSLDANFDSVPPAQCIRIKNFKPPATVAAGLLGLLTAKSTAPLDFFAENAEDRRQWQAYADILGYPDVLTMLNAYFAGNLLSEWDAIFYNDIAPLVFERIVSDIRLSEIATDFSSESKYTGGEKVMRLTLTGTTSRRRNQLPLRLRLDVMSSKMKALREFVTLDVQDVTVSYATAHYNGVLFSGNVSNELLDGAVLYIPESSEEKRNPRRDDAYLAGKLLEHLNSNLEHYNKVLWYNLDADRRYMLLDGFGIQTYNDSGLPIGKNNLRIPLRSLASVVKNELIAIVGNSMVFPVAAGYRVGKDFVDRLVAIDTDDEPGRDTTAKKKRVKLLEHYQPLTPLEPFRISVPTKGVFAEAVQGACNACEKIETDRVQDWTRFRNPDEPTPIGTVTPPIPGVTDWRATFKDFAPPIVSIQNAPSSPAPGAGLAGLAELLGKSDAFKDVTGLDQNQKNAIQAYLSNQENAKAFAEMAKEMAMQSHNTQNSGNIMDSIKQAKDSGDISETDASQLTKDHIQQKIDGGQTKKAELEKEKQATDDTKAATEAIRRIPGDSIGEVVCKDPTGKETAVKATPKPRPPSKGLRNVLVTLSSTIARVGETGSTPMNGNLSIGFGLPGTESSSGGELRRVVFPILTGVDARQVSLRAETYILRPSYEPASASDLTFLHGLQLGAAGVDVPALIGGILEDFSQNLSSLTKGTIATIAPAQNRLNLLFKAQVRKMDEGNAVMLKLDETAGFSVGVDNKISFNSAELPKLVTKLAAVLRDPRAIAIGEGVSALLSLFTVTSNIDSSGKLTGSVDGGVQIKLVPALLESAELTVAS